MMSLDPPVAWKLEAPLHCSLAAQQDLRLDHRDLQITIVGQIAS